MNIKVPTKCARCGRVNEVELPLEEVNSIVDNELARKKALEELKTMILDNADVPNLPEAVILHKNEDGELIIEALDNLCSLDGKRNKGCKSRVNYLIEDIMFRVKHEKAEGEKTEGEGETPKKKRRTKAEMEAAKAAAPKA